jgi:threonine aldolase
MIFMSIVESIPVDAKQVAEELTKLGIKVGVAGKRRFRLVTHYWIDDAAIDKVILAFQKVGTPFKTL